MLKSARKCGEKKKEERENGAKEDKWGRRGMRRRVWLERVIE